MAMNLWGDAVYKNQLIILFLIFLISPHLTSMESAEPAEVQIAVERVRALTWPRVKEIMTDSNIRQLLIELRHTYPNLRLRPVARGLSSEMFSAANLNALPDSDLIQYCWRVLYAISDQAKSIFKRRGVSQAVADKAIAEYLNVYHIKSKLLLARNQMPSGYHDAQKGSVERAQKKFLQQLITKLEYINNLPRYKNAKNRKRTARYLAQLYMLANVSAKSSTTLSDAENQSLTKAADLLQGLLKNGSASNDLLLAELILDYGIYQHRTKEEAHVFAEKLITRARLGKFASKKRQNSHHNLKERDVLEQFGQPSFMYDVKYQPHNASIGDRASVVQNTASQLSRENAEKEQLLPVSSHGNVRRTPMSEPSAVENAPTQDEVDVSSAEQEEQEEEPSYEEIPRLNFIDGAALPVNTAILNPKPMPPQGFRRLTYQGVVFFARDVSSANFDCFFNSIGKTRTEAVEKVRAQLDDEVVRYLLANEIYLWAAENAQEDDADQYRLHPNIASRINFPEFARLWDSLQIDIGRGSVSEGEIGLRQQQGRTMLHRSAARKSVCQLFLREHLDRPAVMMPVQPFSGSNAGSLDMFTAVDAIAYANKLGIKVYELAQGSQRDLKLIHQFIMANAEKVAHLFFDSRERHFQLLRIVDAGLPTDAAQSAGDPAGIADEEEEGENDASVFTWNADRDRELRQRVARGEKKIDIARSFGIEKEIVWGRCSRLGITRRNFRWDDAKDQTLRTMIAAGKGAQEIAELWGISSQVVQVRASRLGEKFYYTRSRWTPENLQRLMVLRAQGYTWPEIGDLCGVTPKAASNQWYRQSGKRKTTEQDAVPSKGKSQERPTKRAK